MSTVASPEASEEEGAAARQPEGDGRPVRVLLVDDDPLVRSGLAMILAQFDGIEVVGAVEDGLDVLDAVGRLRPAVVLMDIRMPGMDGLTATANLRARPDPPEVIVMTTFDTDEHVTRALRVGASGFLLKHTPPGQMADAVRRVAAGEPMMSPEVLRKVMRLASGSDPQPRREAARGALARLSPAEHDVAMLIAEGRTNHEIGKELMISTATVKAYATRIFGKLELSNRVQVAVLVYDAR